MAERVREYGTEAVRHLVTAQNRIGESPIWVPEEERLYWTDTEGSSVFSFAPRSGETRRFKLTMPVTALVRRRGGGWVIVTKKGLAFWDAYANACEFIVDPVADSRSLAFNDGTADPAGRLIAGTMNFNELTAPDGCLFALDTDLTLRQLDDNLCVANGIGFSPDGRTMYVSEQWNSVILAYDYDPATGDATHRRVFAEVDPDQGYPDGVVVDGNGYIWNGRWGGARIVRYTPEGEVDRVYHLPVEVGTCVGFGGRNLRDLYVATAWFGMTAAQRRRSAYSGDLFVISTDVTGLPELRFAG